MLRFIVIVIVIEIAQRGIFFQINETWMHRFWIDRFVFLKLFLRHHTRFGDAPLPLRAFFSETQYLGI